MIKNELEKYIKEGLAAVGVVDAYFSLEHPSDLNLGDYSTNAGIKTGKTSELMDYFVNNKPPQGIEKINVAGPGFINFYLSKKFFKESLKEIIDNNNFGKGEHAKGFKVMVEHTDPNPFKEFHIGHLMPNVIGSTLARVFEWNGAEVKQANYQGDKGLHVAKAVWAMLKGHSLKESYALGTKAFEENSEAKAEIEDLNKKIYEGTEAEVMKVYEEGKKQSLNEFEKMYARLGTKFDYYFFESETAPVGKKIVKENLGKVFEESEGAIVFKGSHTRVFVNSQGLPTYEAKDLGNAKNKFEKYPHDLSVVVTGNEIKEYFKVVLEAMQRVLPDLAAKTVHKPHGMLRLPTGKMSSRTGDVITAESLINEVKEKVKGKEDVAIAAIKYMILRQAIGNDIIFDFDKSISTEGDSGVYLQYAHARACSILDKADKKGDASAESREVRLVERLLYRFPEIVERAGKDYAPNYITTYLTELASSFNNFYAHEQVLEDSPEAAYRLAIVEAFKVVMKNGLTILGIPAPERI